MTLSASPTTTDLQACVRLSLERYFADLEGEVPTGLYDMLVHAIEKPLLEDVLKRTDGNQSKAAQWLGLNRNTLRKKMLEHGLAD